MKKLIKRILKPSKENKVKYEQLVRPKPRSGIKPVLKINLMAFFIFGSLTSFSQAHFDMGFGAGQYKSLNKSKQDGVSPVMRLGAGYEFDNHIATDAIIQASLSRKVNSASFLGAKVGYDLNGFIPSVGYLFNYCNADDKSKNGWGVAYAIKYIIPVNDNGGLFIEGLYCQKIYQFSVGFHVIFNNN